MPDIQSKSLRVAGSHHQVNDIFLNLIINIDIPNHLTGGHNFIRRSYLFQGINRAHGHPIHNVQYNVPPENIVAALETVYEFGRYPINGSAQHG